MRRFSLLFLLALSVLSLWALAAQNAPTPSLPQTVPTATIPPRPTPVWTPTPVSVGARNGTLLLRAQTSRATLFAVVQWQDGRGGWHDVDSWRDTLLKPEWAKTNEQWAIWGVEAKDYGTGPFRWLVYDRQGGTQLAATSAFYLPRAQEARFFSFTLP